MKPQKCMLLGERRRSEKATYGRVPTLWHSENAKPWRQYKDQWFPGGGGGMNRWGTGEVQDSEITLRDPVKMDTCH